MMTDNQESWLFVVVPTMVPFFIFGSFGCGNGGGATSRDDAVTGEFPSEVSDPGTIADDVKISEIRPDVFPDERTDFESVLDGTADIADSETDIIGDTDVVGDTGQSPVVYHCQGFLSCLEDCGSSSSECASICSETIEEPTKTKTLELYGCLTDNGCLADNGKANKDCIREKCLKRYDACLHPGKEKPCLEFWTYFSLCPEESVDPTQYYECVEKVWKSEGADDSRRLGVCLALECKGCNEENLDPVTQTKCAYCETAAVCGGPCQDQWAACTSFGVHSCSWIFDCVGQCEFFATSDLDAWCFNACLSQGSFESQCKFDMLWKCLLFQACPEAEDFFQCASEAIQGTCAEWYDECLQW